MTPMHLKLYFEIFILFIQKSNEERKIHYRNIIKEKFIIEEKHFFYRCNIFTLFILKKKFFVLRNFLENLLYYEILKFE